MGERRIEIAHFWQDHCLSIRVLRTRATRSFDASASWLHGNDTSIRIRDVDEVPSIGRRLSVMLWLPALLITTSIVVAGAAPSRPSYLAELTLSAPPVSIARVDLVPGEVFVVTNRTAATLRVQCANWTVNAPVVLEPGRSIRANPDAVRTCLFSHKSFSWTYVFDPEARELGVARHGRGCHADYEPFRLEINEWGTLVASSREPARFATLPAPPSWVRAPPGPIPVLDLGWRDVFDRATALEGIP